MKTGLLITILLMNVFNNPSKPKFKYVDARTSLYIRATGIAADSSDQVLFFLKDTLHKLKVDLITEEKYTILTQSFLNGVKNTLPDLIASYDSRGATASTQRLRELYTTGTPSQMINVNYTSVSKDKATFKSCDSIGFTYSSLPLRTMSQRPIRVMWDIKECGSRSADSIALFLLRKM